jgi:two-component system response regulator HupR/HoxA
MAAPHIDHRQYAILVVDDEPDILETFEFAYGGDFTIRTASGGSEALAILQREPIAVLVVDQRMPEMTGLELIRRAVLVRPDVVPIMLTGYTDVEALVSAINLGCIRRYIAKPWDTRELHAALQQAIVGYHLERENRRLVDENARLVAELARANDRLAQENRFLRQRDGEIGFAAVVGESDAVRRVLRLARRVAESTTTVLLEGATGTGKELIAKALHYEGPRRQKLFVAVNAGAMQEQLLASTLFGHRRGAFTGATADHKGLFEIADGGTLFLDEIGEMSSASQVALLRVLQEGEIMPIGAMRPVRVDVRVIAATNRDLEKEVAAGRFREDLLHRLRVFPIRCPSLAERLDDIPPLARHIVARQAARLGMAPPTLTADALDALRAHTWRGNVRELENLIERALLLADPGEPLTAAALFDGPSAAPPVDAAANDTPVLAAGSLQRALLHFEREHIREVIAQCNGNKTQAARRLGLSYRGLLLKLQRHAAAEHPAERAS